MSLNEWNGVVLMRKKLFNTGLIDAGLIKIGLMLIALLDY